MSKSVLTTGQVAKMFNVASRTVSKWIDNGYLKGYRLPMSSDRRVTVESVRDFARRNDIPDSAINWSVLDG